MNFFFYIMNKPRKLRGNNKGYNFICVNKYTIDKTLFLEVPMYTLNKVVARTA